MDERKEFLIKIYEQMFNDIDRHILVVWQSATALVAGLAVLALAEKGILPIDVGIALFVLLAGWLLSHLIDASYWYNRNLVIIANIERQFLAKEDLRRIHYYFGAHRPKNRMITHLRIQFVLGVGMATIVLLYHFWDRVYPGIVASDSSFDLLRTFPYATAIAVAVFICWLIRHSRRSYEEFLKNSPGVDVDTIGIAYGEGHGYRPGEQQVGGGA